MPPWWNSQYTDENESESRLLKNRAMGTDIHREMTQQHVSSEPLTDRRTMQIIFFTVPLRVISSLTCGIPSVQKTATKSLTYRTVKVNTKRSWVAASLFSSDGYHFTWIEGFKEHREEVLIFLKADWLMEASTKAQFAWKRRADTINIS